MKVAHLFYYRYPRIHEGLQHTEEAFQWYFPEHAKRALPLYGYLYLEGRWYQKGFPALSPSDTTQIPEPRMMQVTERNVPDEIRAMALLVV